MRLKSRLKQLVVVVVLAAAAYWFGVQRKATVPGEDSTVVGVIDGDTVELADGRTVRLIGIDTPERGDMYYDSASALTERLLLRKRVRLEFDADKIDRYGRTLAFVWDGDELANREIIEQGWAWCYFFEGNLRHSRDLLVAQHRAMAKRVGLWKDPLVESADYYRASFTSYRFHRPDCKSMDKVDPELEVVYHTKDSAFYDGYSPCSRCLP